MRSNFITQSRDKNQIRANFGYKRIGENSNPYPARNKEHTEGAGHRTSLFKEQDKSSTRTYPQCWSSIRDTERTGSELKPTVQYSGVEIPEHPSVSYFVYYVWIKRDLKCKGKTKTKTEC